MSRIVVNQDQLAGTAALLEQSAGEYQAIGTRVASCDCGCMPADVAALVDAITAEMRSRLAGISVGLFLHASDLAWRAGIEQQGGFGTAGGASSAMMTIGGFGSDPSMVSAGTVGSFSVGGSGFDHSLANSGTVGTISVGGSGPDFGDPVVGNTISVGGFEGGFDGGSVVAGNNAMLVGGYVDPAIEALSTGNQLMRDLTYTQIFSGGSIPVPMGTGPQYLPVEFGSYSSPWASMDSPYTRREYWGGRTFDVTYYPEDWNRLIG